MIQHGQMWRKLLRRTSSTEGLERCWKRIDRRIPRVSDCRKLVAAAAAAAVVAADNIAGHETACSSSAIDYSYLHPREMLIIDYTIKKNFNLYNDQCMLMFAS